MRTSKEMTLESSALSLIRAAKDQKLTDETSELTGDLAYQLMKRYSLELVMRSLYWTSKDTKGET